MNLQADACGVARQIQLAVSTGLDELCLGMRCWVRAHLVAPRSIVLCTNPDTGEQATFWLVTDHVGIDDAVFRIVFDGTEFGLEITLEDGVSYFVHRSASFAAAVQSM